MTCVVENKRKLETLCDIDDVDEKLLQKNYKIYNSYSNPMTCDKILLCDNHIYFDAIVNFETIQILITYLLTITANMRLLGGICSKPIYIHINCKGGFIQCLLKFIEFKKSCSIELISIIDKECVDCGILLAAVCNYRIINKKAMCKLTRYDCESGYWSYFKQCNDVGESDSVKKLIFAMLCEEIESKITSEKLEKYFERDCMWDAKKYKKLGLADEIV